MKTLGILMLDTKFRRIPGDIGNDKTFNYKVKKKIVKGATSKKVVASEDMSLLESFIKAAKELEKDGVDAITTSCGFLAMFQKQLANAVNVPIFTSSMIQIKYLFPLLSENDKIGVLTADSTTLNKDHFEGVGIENIPITIYGMEGTDFSKVFVADEKILDKKKIRKEIIKKSKEMIKKEPNIKVIVLECTNMPPYSKDIEKVTGRPVYDIVTLANFIMSGFGRKEYI